MSTNSLPVFNNQWLESCYQQTLLPNGPWSEKVQKLLCDSFAARLSKDLASKLAQWKSEGFEETDCKQMIFESLGFDFHQKYFPQEAWRPQDVKVPTMNETKRIRLKSKVKVWLDSVFNETAVDCRCLRRNQHSSGGAICEEMRTYSDHTRQIFKNGLELELSKLDIARKCKEEKKISIGDKLPLSEGPSNVIGEAIVALVAQDKSRLEQVTSALHGLALPCSLRELIWITALLKAEQREFSDFDAKEILLGRFEARLTQLGVEREITESIASPISFHIRRVVHETYESTAAMKFYTDDNAHINEAMEVLNKLHIHSDTYQPHYIHWLLPLQVAFSRDKESGRHSTKLAMSLDLFIKDVFPGWLSIESIADEVLLKLKLFNPALFAHIKRVMSVDPHINRKEFLICLVSMDKSEARELLDPSSSPSDDPTELLIDDPSMFIKKWLGQLFVGILDSPAMMFVWDQCFLKSWQSEVLEHFALAVLLLLQQKFLHTTDYASLKQVFLNEPCQLYTMDIRKAWLLLQSNGDPKLIPAMNRLTSLEGITEMSSTLDIKAKAIPVETSTRQSSEKETEVALDNCATFDLYIDGLTNIPDRATIVKVTGRIIHGGPVLDDSSYLSALPEIKSSARSPTFTFKRTYNEEGQEVNCAAILLLRVYTVTSDTEKLVILGDCAFSLFNAQQKHLREGAYMKCLHIITPPMMTNPESLHEDSFNELPTVPATRIYFRIQKHSEDHIRAPLSMSDPHYTRLDEPLFETEQAMIKGYLKAAETGEFPMLVSDMIKKLQAKELRSNDPSVDVTQQEWMKNKLDVLIQLNWDEIPEHLSLEKITGYWIATVNIVKAFGLDAGRYTFCTAVPLSFSGDADIMPLMDESKTVIVSQLNIESLQIVPQWVDEPEKVVPAVNENTDNCRTCLLVRLYGIDVVYQPSSNHASPGTIRRSSGGQLDDLQDLLLGWTIVPLTEKGSVCTGEHHVPIFKGDPFNYKSFLKILSKKQVTLMNAIRAIPCTDDNRYKSASLVVKIWDGQSPQADFTAGNKLPRNDELLLAASCRDSCIKAESEVKNMSQVKQFVIEPIYRRYKSNTERGRTYKLEKDLFHDSVQDVIRTLTKQKAT